MAAPKHVFRRSFAFQSLLLALPLEWWIHGFPTCDDSQCIKWPWGHQNSKRLHSEVAFPLQRLLGTADGRDGGRAAPSGPRRHGGPRAVAVSMAIRAAVPNIDARTAKCHRRRIENCMNTLNSCTYNVGKFMKICIF